jgi:hypothetical protein
VISFISLVDFISNKLIPVLNSVSLQIIISSLAAFFLAWLNSRWKRKQDKEIETFKKNMDKEIEVMNSTLSLYTISYHLAQGKRFNAIETTWKNFYLYSEELSKFLYFYERLTTEEYNKGKIENKEISIPPYENIENIERHKNEINILRPFLGENLWSLLFVYDSFFCRVIYGLYSNFTKDKLVYKWTEDVKLFDVFGLIFKLETPVYKRIIDYTKIPLNGLRFIKISIETLIIEEIRKILIGKETVKEILTESSIQLQAESESNIRMNILNPKNIKKS